MYFTPLLFDMAIMGEGGSIILAQRTIFYYDDRKKNVATL
jgi:hypothetical protein